MKNRILWISALAVLLIATSCEEKMVVIPDPVVIESDKVILVEELTGVRCPNCPAGSAALAEIQEKYGDNVAIVGIHGTDLTKPLDVSNYDFRNEDAIDLENFLKPYLGKPAAYFNRVFYDDLQGDWGNSFNSDWERRVVAELEKPLQINLFLDFDFDPENRELFIKTTVQGIEDIDGELKLTIMLLESGIIDAQDDQNVVILDYEHNHVLREIITAFDGDFFADGIEVGQLIEREYTYTVPEEDDGLWVSENLEVVAAIAYTEGESEEILQAAKTKLKE